MNIKNSKVSKTLQKKIKDYYGFKGLIIRTIFFLISYTFITPAKILKKIWILKYKIF